MAELTGTAGSYGPDAITPVIRPLYADLVDRLKRAGLPVAGPAIAYYEDAPDGGVVVHAGLTVAVEPDDDHDFAIVELPAVAQAATIVHRGSMDEVLPTYEALARWIDINGYRMAGHAREFYLNAASDECESLGDRAAGAGHTGLNERPRWTT
jgi:effector-binding domain-containing protein